MKEEERGGGSELGSDLDPDPWKILWIRINEADHLDPDPQHRYKVSIGLGQNPYVVKQWRKSCSTC